MDRGRHVRKRMLRSLVAAALAALFRAPARGQTAPEAAGSSVPAVVTLSSEAAQARRERDFRLCVSSYTPETILAGYGRDWSADWLKDGRSWSAYHALVEAYEYRAHLAGAATPCALLKGIRYTPQDPASYLNQRCRDRYHWRRFIWSVLQERKPDPEHCRKMFLALEDNPVKKGGADAVCGMIAKALRDGKVSEACAKIPDPTCRDWLAAAAGEYGECRSTDALFPIERGDCEADAELVRALRSPVPDACGESAVCTYFAKPGRDAVTKKDKVLVEEFCAQWARVAEGARQPAAVVPKQEAK